MWTYTGLPATSTRDEVRFLVGDTDHGSQLVTDEEITYALAAEGNTHTAAALVAKSIAAKFAPLIDRAIGDLKISFSQRQKHFKELADELQARGDVSGGRMFAGGISVADKETEVLDPDRVVPAFRKGQHDIVGANEDDSNQVLRDDS